MRLSLCAWQFVDGLALSRTVRVRDYHQRKDTHQVMLLHIIKNFRCLEAPCNVIHELRTGSGTLNLIPDNVRVNLTYQKRFQLPPDFPTGLFKIDILIAAFKNLVIYSGDLAIGIKSTFVSKT